MNSAITVATLDVAGVPTRVLIQGWDDGTLYISTEDGKHVDAAVEGAVAALAWAPLLGKECACVSELPEHELQARAERVKAEAEVLAQAPLDLNAEEKAVDEKG